MTTIYQEYYNQIESVLDMNCHKRNFKRHKQDKKLEHVIPRGKCGLWFCQFNLSGFRVKPK